MAGRVEAAPGLGPLDLLMLNPNLGQPQLAPDIAQCPQGQNYIWLRTFPEGENSLDKTWVRDDLAAFEIF